MGKFDRRCHPLSIPRWDYVSMMCALMLDNPACDKYGIMSRNSRGKHSYIEAVIDAFLAGERVT